MEKAHKVALYWFRRAVRLTDNRSLIRAVKDATQVVPVFILDPAILTHMTTGFARTRFLFEALSDIDAGLRECGSRLIVRYGKPVEELERLVQETGATALYFANEYEPYGRERDDTVKAAMAKRGVTVVTENDHLLVEPHEVLSKAGTPYTVFTPYKRVWFEQPIPSPIPAPKQISVPENLHSEPLPTLPTQYGVSEAEQDSGIHGTEADAQEHLNRFVRQSLGEYDTGRDFPGTEGTSRLSAYLRMGVISPRQVLAKVQGTRSDLSAPGKESANTFLSELAWRDFYYQILWHFPHVAGGAFRKVYDALAWENDEALFAAWCEGKTGYPFIDAAQRQLNQTAWMHNRARMATASFLTKDLLIDWRWGERYFMQRLIDGDLAPNNGGWQWAAGTGTDAQPYFRIFNPVSQGEKFDPDGAYVKRYVPELVRIPAKYIHQPWKLSPSEQEYFGCVLGKDYPHPIVDHKVQRDKALRLYKRASGGEAG